MQTTTTKQQHVQRPKLFNQQELESRIAAVQEQFKNSHAACIRVNEGILPTYTKKVIELVNEGYTFNEVFPCSAHPGSYTAYMNKPVADQEADLLRVANEVEDKYRQEIEDWNQAQKALLADQLYQAEKKKVEDAERKKEEKLRAQAEKEADEYFNSVVTKEQESK